jgi:hypothetical protein
MTGLASSPQTFSNINPEWFSQSRLNDRLVSHTGALANSEPARFWITNGQTPRIASF